MSASVVPIHGMASNVRILEILRSINIFSSASDAMLLRGPIRTQIRPRYLTGGNSDGLTSTTSKSPPSKTKRSTVITGCGRILPSVRILVILSSRPSSTRRPDNFPLSSAPIIRQPLLSSPGKSLEKAQIAWQNLSILVVEVVISMLQLSGLPSICTSCFCVNIMRLSICQDKNMDSFQ